jgi:hypothetical protein
MSAMDKEIWFRKGLSFEEEAKADREFWEQMTGSERVQVLLDMRGEAWKVGGKRISRLRRVARVVERS